jgi:pyrimidine-nucleoside phosphorylase
MDLRSIIQKKQSRQALAKDEIAFFVKGCSDNSLPDYQISALLMAIFLKGMNQAETQILTEAMTQSGGVYDLSVYGKKCIDKHSTGGVGDKVSFICGPIAASLGIKVPMLSGRGLGHTGGTLDKMGAIPGVRTDLSKDEFLNVLEKTGVVIASATSDFVPADKKLYALRDATETVASMPLILSSILSKKLAGGAAGITFDVKVGNGAFLPALKDAKALSKNLVRMTKKAGRAANALITPMGQPLGRAVGNLIEMYEASETLLGRGPEDVTEVSCRVAAAMLILAGAEKNNESAQKTARKQIANKEAHKVFLDMLRAQGGENVDSILNGFSFKPAAVLKAQQSGFLSKLPAKAIGEAACRIGAGRLKASEAIDPQAGIYCCHKEGDKVKEGDDLLYFYSSLDVSEIVSSVAGLITISKERFSSHSRIIFFK